MTGINNNTNNLSHPKTGKQEGSHIKDDGDEDNNKKRKKRKSSSNSADVVEIVARSALAPTTNFNSFGTPARSLLVNLLVLLVHY